MSLLASPESSQNRDDQSLFWAPRAFWLSMNSCNSAKAQHCIHVTFDVDIMHKCTSFYRLFISQLFPRSQAIHISQSCASARALWFDIVRCATATATNQRQRQHHMSVSSPSCAGARASFRIVCCCWCRQHTTVRAICHRAQAHELFIFGNDGKECWRRNSHAQAHKQSISHRAQAHKLLTIWQWQQRMSITRSSRASAQGIHIASGDGDDNNNGDDDNECRRQGLGHERPAFSYRIAQQRWRQQLFATTNDECRTARPRGRAHNIFTSCRPMAMKTTKSSAPATRQT